MVIASSVASEVESPNKSTPASSPPLADSPESSDGLPDSMQKEEQDMRNNREKADAKREKEMAAKRQKDLEGGSAKLDEKFNQLQYLIKQSQLWSNIMLEKMTKAEEEEAKQGEKGRQREAQAEKAAEETQRRATQGTAGTEQKALPVRGRGRPKKDAASDSKITARFKEEKSEEEIQHKAEEDEDGAKTSDVGFQDVKSALQPALVTGGVMRKY
ncbi:hypothetical protein LTS18_003654, partial [Coniosporium uncinatum]